MDSPLAFFAVVSIAAILIFISKSLFKKHPKPEHPPGPKPWPIIGNLNLIGPIPHQSLHILAKKYGDIMQLKFGKFPVVVASSPEMAKQFLRTYDQVFADRPALAAGKYMAYNYSDMLWAPYGPYLRHARKIYLMELFRANKFELYRHVRTEERSNFLSQIHALSGRPIKIRDHVLRYTLSVLSRVIFVKSFSTEEMNDFQAMVDEMMILYGVFNIGDWIPWLSALDLQGYVKKMKALHKKVDAFLSNAIDDHHTRRSLLAHMNNDGVLEALSQLDDDPNADFQITRDRMKGLIQDLLIGGADTTATAIEWAILEIVKQPRIIEKAKEELNRVIGRNRWVEESDFAQLPYLQSIIKETMRMHSLTTLLAPHCAIEDCIIEGYLISKGTTVLINTWSIGRDPRTWDSPEEFMPERFIEKDIDMLGNNFALLPFGSGRRRCPGYELGLKMCQSILANCLHGFNWKLPEGTMLSRVEEYGIITHPKVPLNIIMEPVMNIPF